MKHGKLDLDKRPGSDPLVRVGVGQRPKFNFFRPWSCSISN